MTTTDVATIVEQPSGLALWAQGAREVHQLAEHIASSALVPKAYHGKPVDVLACWLTGQELGIAPMASLRAIDVISGTPSLRAHAMRALVQSHGHDVEIVENDDRHCVMRGRRKGSETWQTVAWDLDRAKLLGLASKDQWRAQPRTMLIARATGEVCRLIAADVLYAVPYTSEEMADEQVPVRATATVTAADLLADMPTPAAEMPRAPRGHGDPASGHADPAPMTRRGNYQETATLPGDTSTEPAGTPEPQGITGPQMRKLQALFKEAGIDDRGSRLAWASDVAGRELASSNDLTRVEAGKVIEAVEAFIVTERGPLPDKAAEVDAEAQQPELS